MTYLHGGLIITLFGMILCQTTHSSPPNVTFECVDKNVRNIRVVGDTNSGFHVLIEKTNICSYTEPKCLDATNKSPSVKVILQKDAGLDEHNNVLTHESYRYSLACVDEYDVHSLKIAIHISKPTVEPTPKVQTKPAGKLPTLSLQVLKTNDSPIGSDQVYIGTELKLKLEVSGMTRPTIKPQKCTAFDDENVETTSHVIWSEKSENGKCSEYDDQIIKQEKWQKKQNAVPLTIGMYAFRFTTTDKVYITCSAHICPSNAGGCAQVCVNEVTSTGSSRKRRQVKSNLNETSVETLKTATATTSFTVLLTDEIQSNKACNFNYSAVLLFVAFFVFKKTSNNF